MEENKSPLKAARAAAGRAAKSQQDGSSQRDAGRTAGRPKDGVGRTRGDGSGVHAGRTSTGGPQDRARPRRLTGRTGSGERGKGASQAQQDGKAGRGGGPRGHMTHQDPLSTPDENRPRSKPSRPMGVRGGHPGEGSDRRPAGESGPDVAGLVEEGSFTSDQQLGLKQAEERLQRDYIHRLVKQSPDYPHFHYLCKLCCVHVDNIQGAHKHIKEKRHKKNLAEKQEENELRSLAPPTPAHLEAVQSAVMETARQHGISEEDFQQRQTVLHRMEGIIQGQMPSCSLRMYGSCLTRFAFKTSDLNIDVVYPPSMTQPDVLIQVLDILKKSEFIDVESDFHAKVPVVFCRDVASNFLCKVSAGNDVACLTTNHLAALARLEPRLIPLVLAFRYWAKLCHVDCQAEGGIPSYSFSLMVIFFLQQRKPPILPVYLGYWLEGFDVKRVDEFHLQGVQGGTHVGWEQRPSSGGDGRGDKNKNDPHRAERGPTQQGKARLVLEKVEGVSVGQLWLELFRFYTLEFAMEDYIISVRLKELLPRDVKNWPRRRLAIEDPFALKRNVARSLNSQMVFEYIQERLRTAYRYFACPQSRDEPASGPAPSLSPAPGHAPGQPDRPQSEERDAASSSDEDDEEDSNGEDGRVGRRVQEEEQRVSADLAKLVVTDQGAGLKREGGDAARQPSSPPPSPQNGVLLDSEEDEQAEERRKRPQQRSIAPEDLHYIFDRMIFTGGKPPTVVCSICKRDGHLKDDCPEDFKKMELAALPPMTERFRDILDRLCHLCYNELSPSLAEQQKREQILASLERFIRKEYNDKAQLCLFGSSKNGFGFRDSDLDICMTLEGHDTAEKLNCKEIIECLAKVLKKHTGLRNILPITTAKVPIVKFEHKQSGLEGDISLYNTLAQHNTRMLATYAALDPRVQYLGYTMKVFAKRCDIGDASRGSLSSYAYILMVLYFLQQRQPPVIPVLQEIYDGSTVPQRMVDGWNAFFFDDLDELRRRGQEFQRNSETVGQLWLALLRFYTEEFDFKEHVISIRQHKRLTTFEKQWTSKCIAIEDPFDLNHNLGAGVSRKMTNFIMKAFINGRKLFGTPFYPLPGMEADYFFDSRVLTDGELAPNDRCCRICGKIGHYMKDCPKRRRMKKKESEKDEEVREEDRESRERRCFQCGDMGHVRRDCPEYRHLRHRGAPVQVPQMVRALVSSQAIPIPQSGTPQERLGRTRQPSECSETRQTPPYSPQPAPFSQPSVSPKSSQSGKSSSSSASSSVAPPQSTPLPQQVQLPSYSFGSSHPAPFRGGAPPTLGLLPPPTQPSALPPSSWPIHGHVLQGHPSPPVVKFPVRRGKSGGSEGQGISSAPVNLNDPSIIFAQPAGRPGVGGASTARDGGHHWRNHHLDPGALVANGTVGKTEAGFQPPFGSVGQTSRSWEPSASASFSISPSWSYGVPQTFLPQPGKPFLSQGANQPFPLLQPGHHINLSYIQQKK
ncbi:terminal uridylyltransferase 4 isoform X2 [Brachyhypopomus gauderio]|uniref:terminal uridylyltransferase 4 isoform X2 n=1 Tax=Brachyhypopomus gauderio TaxID=698409 RepID=UPI00404218AB